MRSASALVLVTLVTAHAFAATPAAKAEGRAAAKPSDFAYAIPIRIEGQEAFYGVRLPAAVYRGLTRGDRGDLRVFDAQDRIVQHALNLAPPVARPPVGAPVTLPLFATGEATDATPAGGLHVRVEARGALAEVTEAPATAGKGASRYLLDASALQTRIASLRFVWPATTKPLVVPLVLECSNDLEHWNRLAGTSLADLQAAGHRLRQDTLVMPAVKCTYLRFTWPAADTKLERVEATPVSPQVAPPVAPMERLELKGASGAEGSWEYDTGGLFPVDMLELAFAGANTVMDAAVQVRDATDAPWREVYHGLVYDYEVEGHALRSQPVTLPEITSRYWRVKPASSEGAPAAAPQLRLGWHGDPLVFVNSGVPPYRLAFGSRTVRPSGATIASLFGAEHPPVKPATLGEQQELTGPAALRAPSAPVPTQRYALWAILGLGIAGLGTMAVRLWKEMGRPS